MPGCWNGHYINKPIEAVTFIQIVESGAMERPASGSNPNDQPEENPGLVYTVAPGLTTPTVRPPAPAI